MKFNINILTTILLISTLLSCEKNNTTNEGENKIVEIVLPPTGCWNEIEDESILQFSGTNHTFCFLSETEFTLELESWTDIVSDNHPSQWLEYIKGTYVLTNQSFEITGYYMDSDYINLETSLLGETEFENTFAVKVVSETEIILNNNDNNPNLGIRLLN